MVVAFGLDATCSSAGMHAHGAALHCNVVMHVECNAALSGVALDCVMVVAFGLDACYVQRCWNARGVVALQCVMLSGNVIIVELLCGALV